MRFQLAAALGFVALALVAGCSTAPADDDADVTEGALVSRPLPSFDQMWLAYPRGEAEDVKKAIGGAVNADWITNTCTIRVSGALNGAGFMIPSGPSLNSKGLHTVKGADGNNYAFRVAEMKAYLLSAVGKPSLVVKAGSGGIGVDPTQFAGKKGILMFDVRVWDDATGHFDVWNGKQPGHEVYFDKAAEVWLWEAQGTSASDPPPDEPVTTEPTPTTDDVTSTPDPALTPPPVGQ